MENGNTNDPGNAGQAFAMGVQLGELRARLTACEASAAAVALATGARIDATEGRLTDLEGQGAAYRQALQLLAGNASMRFVRGVDDASGEDTLTLAPDGSGKGDKTAGSNDSGGTVDPGDAPAAKPAPANPFLAYTKVKTRRLV